MLRRPLGSSWLPYVLGKPPKKCSAEMALLVGAISGATKIRCSDIQFMLTSMQNIAVVQLAQTGTFVIPGLVKITKKHKNASSQHEKKMFGKTVLIKAKPPRTIIKASPKKALKDNF